MTPLIAQWIRHIAVCRICLNPSVINSRSIYGKRCSLEGGTLLTDYVYSYCSKFFNEFGVRCVSEGKEFGRLLDFLVGQVSKVAFAVAHAYKDLSSQDFDLLPSSSYSGRLSISPSSFPFSLQKISKS